MTAGIPSEQGGPDPGNRTDVEPPDSDLTMYQCETCGGVGVGAGTMRCCGAAMTRVEPSAPAESPELADILGDVLGMSETELRICILLMGEGPKTAGEVAEAMDVDPSFANRLLNHLVRLDVVEERSYIMESGGRVSRYEHAPVPDVEQSFKRELCLWLHEALRIVDEELVAEKEDAMARAHDLVDELDDDSIYFQS